MERRECKREILASGSVAAVEACSCGAIHLTIGAVTVRLAPEACLSIAETLGEAAPALAWREARKLVEGRVSASRGES